MPSSACHVHSRDLHSFPTRRSSDLRGRARRRIPGPRCPRTGPRSVRSGRSSRRRSRPGGRTAGTRRPPRSARAGGPTASGRSRDRTRSEEHTSELQSPDHLVCRLLLVTCTPEIYTLSLHDALPIFGVGLVGEYPVLDVLGQVLVAFDQVEVAVDDLVQEDVQQEPAALPGQLGLAVPPLQDVREIERDRKSTRLNSSHQIISYAVFCLSRALPRSTLFPYTTLFRSSGSGSSANTRSSMSSDRSS